MHQSSKLNYVDSNSTDSTSVSLLPTGLGFMSAIEKNDRITQLLNERYAPLDAARIRIAFFHEVESMLFSEYSPDFIVKWLSLNAGIVARFQKRKGEMV
jgi:hypothetical protein